MERLRSVWLNMIARCENPNAYNYEWYGHKGVKVCEEWHEYEVFKEWALKNGYDKDAPRGVYTIDRIDVNGNYEPSNCRWATMKEQARNKRSLKYVEIEGDSKILPVWAEENNIPLQVIYSRYYHRNIRGKDLIKPCKVIAGENVKRLKELRGDMDYRILARKSSVKPSTIRKIEEGKFFPRGLVSRKLARYFNLPVETFTCTFEEGE